MIDDPEDVLRGYIEHRLEREQQILEALRGGEARRMPSSRAFTAG